MTSLAYELEDSFSAQAAQHRNRVLGLVCSACAALFGILGDVLRSLGDPDDIH